MNDTPNTNQDHAADPPGADDALLTAYALGELEPGSDVYEQVHARLKTDAAAKAYVEQARVLGEQLGAAYRANDTASSGLLEHQQKELAAMIDQQDNTPTGPITPAKPFWLSRPALIAAGLALAAGAAINMMGPDELAPIVKNDGAGDSITGITKISESLSEPVAVDFDDATLSEVFAFLNKQTKVAFDTDWDALAKRGIDAKTPVTLQSDELIPAGRVLTAALQAAWSQSQHPDPAQWMMTDAGVTVAPQSALVEARLQATTALLKSDRLSKAPLDKRVLTADRAEVWESDLWNNVLAQRDEAGVAVLAEADAAFDAAEASAAEENFERAANQTMYAYHLLRANNSLLTSDQFTEPNERFQKLNEQIATHHQEEDAARLAEAIEEAKAERATLDEKAIQELNNKAAEKVAQAEQVQQQGYLGGAAQLYEQAVLLNPTDETYWDKLAESKAALKKQVRTLGVLDTLDTGLAGERSDRHLVEFGTQFGRSVNGLDPAKGLVPADSIALSLSSAPPITAVPSGTNTLYRAVNDSSANYAIPEQQTNQQFFFAPGGQGQAQGAGPEPSVRYRGLEKKTKDIRTVKPAESVRYERSAVVRESLYAQREADFDGIRLANRPGAAQYGPDDYLAKPVVQPQHNKEGKTITRRAQLEQRLEQLVVEKPLPQLDEPTQAQYKSISIALEDAKTLEKLELARLEAIRDLQELNDEFHRGCIHMFEDDPSLSRDAFALVNDNPFYNPADPGRAMSTFSVDVDTAAYTIARRQLMQRNQLPVPGAVRIEEMINYFDYNYKAPVVDADALEDGVVTQASLEAFENKQEGFAPFATHLQVTDCPWQAGNQLVRIGIKGMEVAQEDRPSAHLTFLLDVSGSMNRPNKLGLVKDSLKMLLDKLNDKDHVSIVVYAGASGIVLENAPATNKAQIEAALDKLRAGGSTAGAAGIQLAYQTAQKHYIDGGVNRVILCTDGDFNVGISGTDALVDLIKSKANPQADEDGKRRGVYLSVMGYGMGNLNDAMMEPLTNAGNGNYAYIDTIKEATKVMYDQAGASLVTIAKDVKVQVHFDASQVMAYRLIGYENRVLANEDFDNDKVDAGDIGAGHSVTALYEIVPFPSEDELDGNEGFFEVRHRIEELQRAVTLNHTLMQTASLTPKQSMKLAASTRMLEQEVMLANAVADKLDGKKPINAEVDVDENPAAPGDVAHEAASKERFDDGAMMAVKLRYKPVDAPAEDGTSRLIASRVFADEAIPFAVADDSTRFAASVASFAMQLRSSPHAGDVDLDWVHDIAKSSSNHDPSQLKAELLELVKKAKELMPQAPEAEGAEDTLLR